MTSVLERVEVLDGDGPGSAIVAAKKQDARVKLLMKNVMSLQMEQRLDELMAELDTTEWNAVLLNETWREKKEELWSTPSGHLFCGAGGTIGERGVGIILHKNIARGFRAFHAMTERLCAVDVAHCLFRNRGF